MFLYQIGFNAVYHPQDTAIYVTSKRGVRRFFARPFRGERLCLGEEPLKWQPYMPRIRFGRLLDIAASGGDCETDFDVSHNDDLMEFHSRPSSKTQDFLRTAKAVSAFIRDAGEMLCRAVGAYNACSNQPLFLCYLQSTPGLASLTSNPALLFAVLCAAKSLGKGDAIFSFLHRAACQSVRRTARELGFPNARLLRRVATKRLTESLVRKLRRLCTSSENRRILSHLEVITPDVVELMSDPEIANYLDNRFLTDMGRRAGGGEPLPTAIDVGAIVRFLNNYRSQPVRIQSVRHVQHLYERYPAVELSLRGDLSSMLSVCLPPPPIPEEQGYAVALRTPDQLIAESIQMQNCVATLYRKVQNRTAYYYRIEKAWGLSRGTMEIVYRDGIWRIAEIVGPRNSPYPRKHIHNLAIWLADRQAIQDETLCFPERKGGLE